MPLYTAMVMNRGDLYTYVPSWSIEFYEWKSFTHSQLPPVSFQHDYHYNKYNIFKFSLDFQFYRVLSLMPFHIGQHSFAHFAWDFSNKIIFIPFINFIPVQLWSYSTIIMLLFSNFFSSLFLTMNSVWCVAVDAVEMRRSHSYIEWCLFYYSFLLTGHTVVACFPKKKKNNNNSQVEI